MPLPPPKRCDSEFTEGTEYTNPSFATSADSYGFESCDQSSVSSYDRRRDQRESRSSSRRHRREHDTDFCNRARIGRIEDVASESMKAMSLSATMVTDAIASLTSACMVNPMKNCVTCGTKDAKPTRYFLSANYDVENHKRQLRYLDTGSSSSSYSSSDCSTDELSVQTDDLFKHGQSIETSYESATIIGKHQHQQRFRKPFRFLRRNNGVTCGNGDQQADTVVSSKKRQQAAAARKNSVLEQEDGGIVSKGSFSSKGVGVGGGEKVVAKRSPARNPLSKPRLSVASDSVFTRKQKHRSNKQRRQQQEQLQKHREQQEQQRQAPPPSAQGISRIQPLVEERKTIVRIPQHLLEDASRAKEMNNNNNNKSTSSLTSLGSLLKRRNKAKAKAVEHEHPKVDNNGDHVVDNHDDDDDEGPLYFKKGENISKADNIHTIHVGRTRRN
ncbi:hypothetical protein ACA910_007719 [Epithemia clementina (nom. ined.)]